MYVTRKADAIPILFPNRVEVEVLTVVRVKHQAAPEKPRLIRS